MPHFDAHPPALADWWSDAGKTFAALPSPPSIPSSLNPQTRIVSDNAYLHAAARAEGCTYPIVPYWAPELGFLISPSLTNSDAIRQPCSLRIGAVHIQRTDSPNWPYWKTVPFFTTIIATWPLLETGSGLELRLVPDVP